MGRGRLCLRAVERQRAGLPDPQRRQDPLGAPAAAAIEDEKKKKDPIIWAGPVLAGDRLIVLSSVGDAISVSPYTGEPLGREADAGRRLSRAGDRRQLALCADRRRQSVRLSLIRRRRGSSGR